MTNEWFRGNFAARCYA